MLNLLQLVGSEIMTVLHVEGAEETKGWVSIFHNLKLRLLRPDATLTTSEFLVAFDENGRLCDVGAPQHVSFDTERGTSTVQATFSSSRASGWYPRGCGPGEVELAREVLSTTTLTVIGRSGESKLVESYVPGVKVGDPVVVFGDKAAKRAPAAPTGRIVSLSRKLDNGRVLTVDSGRDGIAILGGGLTFQKNKNAVLDFTGNVIVEILDR